MWYFESLMILYCLAGAGVIIGRALCRFLPFRQRGKCRTFLSPAVGLGVIILIAALTGWIWGFHQAWCLPPLIVIVTAALFTERRIDRLLAHLGMVFAIATISSAAVLFPLLRYNTYNPYNDTFTYIEHAQWLQSHPFREHGVVSANAPAVAEVLNYQDHGLRMGASFTLGWVQAIFKYHWSYRVYPATVALAVTACSMALAAVAYRFCRKRLVALLIAMAFPLTYNGFMHGAVTGFFPMTFGLAMDLAWFGLYGDILASEARKWRLRCVIPASICLAAATFSYNEVVPFSVLAGGIAMLLALALRPAHRGRIVAQSLAMGILSLALVNGEIVRIVRALRMESDFVTGWGVDWKLWMYPTHMVGLHTGSGDVEAWFVPQGIFFFLLLLFALTAPTVWAILLLRRRRRPPVELIPYLLMLIVCVGAFAYFRYAVKSPFSVGLGQTWSEFKLSNWSSPAYWALLAGFLAWISRRGKWIGQICVFIVVAGVIGTGLRGAFTLSEDRTNFIRYEMGRNGDVFASFLNIRDAAQSASSSQLIYLDLGGDHYKAREMVTYFLDDKKLGGNWGEDVYFNSLPLAESSVPFSAGDWILSPMEIDGASPAGPFYFFPRPRTMVRQGDVRHGYIQESNGKDWWRWTDGRLDFDFAVIGEPPPAIHVSFSYLPFGESRNVRMNITGATLAYEEKLVFKEGEWGRHETGDIPLKDRSFTIHFSCDQPPMTGSAREPRKLSYLIKNLRVEARSTDGADPSSAEKSATHP